MIWNKALSSNEIINVSESIVGTPNIGNIFYDNGFAVITHPKYKNVLRKDDISTISLDSSTNLETTFLGGVGNIQGARFNSDGTKLLAIENSTTRAVSSSILTYNLSTPYEISTLEYSNKLDFTEKGTKFTDIEFSYNGKKMFLLSNNSNEEAIWEYSLSSSYDPGSKAFLRKRPLNNVPNHFAIRISNDGKKVFILEGNAIISEYNLKTPFNISQLTKIQEHDVNSITKTFTVGAPIEFLWSEDGYKLFIGGNNSDEIAVYETPVPFDLKYLKKIGNHVSVATPITLASMNIRNNKLYVIDQSSVDDIYQYTIKPSGDIKEFKYKNTHLITENEYQCTMTEDEFEFTRNLSTLKVPFSDSEDVASFVTGSNFKPYVTTVGLYDDSGNLLVIGKLGQPIKASSETDTTFVIRFDT